MKKLMIGILILALCLTAGCASKDTPIQQEQGNSGTMTESVPETMEPIIIAGTLPQMWGEEIVPQETYSNGKAYEPFGEPFTVEITNSRGTSSFSVNVPAYEPSNRAGENLWIVTTGNDNDILIDYVRGEISSIETAMDTVFEEVKEGFDSRTHFYELSYTQKDAEVIEAGGRQMAYAKYLCSYEFNGSENTYSMLVYTVQLTNGTYVYWVVWNGDIYMHTRQTAENMAYTFTEMNPS